MKIVVLERHSVGADVPVQYEHLGQVVYYHNTTTVQEVSERVRDAEIIVANKAPLREETLKNAPHVRLICELATGFDNVDLAYCKSRGIKVCNVVDYCSGMVAQHTFALALALLEKLPHYDQYVKSGAYSAQDRFSNFDLPFHELEGMTWGIIGMGNIGRRVARIAAAFGCRVIFYSVTGASSCRDYPQVDKETLLAESDILSLHCPLSALTRGIIDREALGANEKDGGSGQCGPGSRGGQSCSVRSAGGRGDRRCRTGCGGWRAPAVLQSSEPYKGQLPADYHAPSGLGQRGGPHPLRGRGSQKHRGIPKGPAPEYRQSLRKKSLRVEKPIRKSRSTNP